MIPRRCESPSENTHLAVERRYPQRLAAGRRWRVNCGALGREPGTRGHLGDRIALCSRHRLLRINNPALGRTLVPLSLLPSPSRSPPCDDHFGGNTPRRHDASMEDWPRSPREVPSDVDRPAAAHEPRSEPPHPIPRSIQQQGEAGRLRTQARQAEKKLPEIEALISKAQDWLESANRCTCSTLGERSLFIKSPQWSGTAD